MTFEPKDFLDRDSEQVILFDDDGAIPLPEDTPLSIGNVSRLFRVSRLRLRLYEYLGLIGRRHRFGQGVVYSWEDCARLSFILKARRAGFGVMKLAPILKAANPNATPEAIERARAECLHTMEQLEGRSRTLRDLIAEFRLHYGVLSEKLPNSGAAAVRSEGGACA